MMQTEESAYSCKQLRTKANRIQRKNELCGLCGIFFKTLILTLDTDKLIA